MKTALKGTVQRGFEGLWSIGFWLAGRLSRGTPEIFSSVGDQQVLVVAPHPDDEVAGCAGAILQHRRRGDRVRVCCVTDGRRSRALGLAPEAMARTRRGEIEAAVAHLDAELEWLGMPEGEWGHTDLAKRLRRVLERERPEVIYGPSRIDFHPEHEKVARALASACAELVGDRRPEVRIYPVQVPLTPILANLIVPLAAVGSQLTLAFGAYRSQLGSIERCLRQRRYAGRYYGLDAVEELWRLSTAQYERLHRGPASPSLERAFRGLRYYAWSDPAAYLQGRGMRRRLAALGS